MHHTHHTIFTYNSHDHANTNIHMNDNKNNRNAWYLYFTLIRFNTNNHARHVNCKVIDSIINIIIHISLMIAILVPIQMRLLFTLILM